MKTRPPRFLDRHSPPHLATLILLAGLSALSMNVFLPSLPNMAAYFGVDYSVMQLSVSLYLGFSAALQLVIGPLSDRYGRRRVLLWAMALFLLASVGTLLATTAEAFLFFRMTQAVIATAMTLSRAIVRDMVDEDRAASMLGYVTMGMAVAPMLGPVVGGILDEAFGWQANFGMLLLAGIAVTALAWYDLGETARSRPTSLMAQVRDYPALFASPRFWGYVASASLSSGVFFAYLGGAPFIGTDYYGLSPSALGLYFSITALGYGLGNFLSGKYSVRFGVNRMIMAGAQMTVLGVGLQLLGLAVGFLPDWVFFGLFLIVGIGNGMVLPNATAGMLSVRPHLAGTASGLGGAIMIGGGAAVSALAAAMLTPGSGPLSLILLMLACAVASVIAIALVIRRARMIGRA